MDTFICGACKGNFNSLSLFLQHKSDCDKDNDPKENERSLCSDNGHKTPLTALSDFPASKLILVFDIIIHCFFPEVR